MKTTYFKKISAVLIVISLGMISASADDYCDGYEQGYQDGYKEMIRSSLDPMVPSCTLQPISQFDQPEKNYRDGYNQGHKEGKQKAEEQ